MSDSICVSERGVSELTSMWRKKQKEIDEKGDRATQYEMGIAQGYRQSAMELDWKLEKSRSEVMQKLKEAEEIRREAWNRNQFEVIKLQNRRDMLNAIRTLLMPLILFFVYAIMESNPRLLVPFVLFVVIINITAMRWSLRKDILLPSLLIGIGLVIFIICNWRNDIWLRLKIDAAPEVAGAGILVLVYFISSKRYAWDDEEKMRIVTAALVVLLGINFAVNIPGLSFLENIKELMKNLSVELMGAGFAIIALLEEEPGEE